MNVLVVQYVLLNAYGLYPILVLLKVNLLKLIGTANLGPLVSVGLLWVGLRWRQPCVFKYTVSYSESSK